MGCTSLETQKTLSFKDWEPAVSPESIFKKFVFFLDVQSSGKKLYWVEGRPSEKGRYVIVEKDSKGNTRDITPKGYSARSRVYEYGGSSYIVKGDDLYFVNFKDQRIYWQDLTDSSQIKALTPKQNNDGSTGKSMDFTLSKDGKWLAFVYEKEIQSKENPNYIAVLNVEEKKVSEPKIIVKGADFYKSPLFSPDGTELAWKEWNHPFMPWYSTDLYLGKFNDGRMSTKKRIVGGDQTTVGSLNFNSDGELLFTMDKPNQTEKSPLNYYNIYVYSDGKVRPITKKLSGFSGIKVKGNTIYSVSIKEGQASLVKINSQTGKFESVQKNYNSFSFLNFNHKNELIGVAYSTTKPPSIVNFTKNKVIKTAYKLPIKKQDISLPITVKYPTQDGEHSYGYFYPPKNSRYKAPKGELPPVRVLVHGGPTGSTSTSFSASRNFWTSQGYAVFDVNYRGSTGYGRKYRDALLKKWGILEIRDVKDGLDYLKTEKLISSTAFVSGGSAGGYSVQRLLTYYPDLFQGGASHFGIGNLITLQKLTHKYESHYLSQLIGGTLKTNLKEYKDRSPINHLNKLKAPMIIFQGAEDKVVPPENSREMAEILKKRGVYHEYYEYPEEGHGFRNKDNLIHSLSKEAAFFKKIQGEPL
jgi:dipeptidyl aminopeptidase/acylaminoacyl peptidase